MGLRWVRPLQRAQPSCPPASVPPGPQLCLPLLFSSQSFFFFFFKLSPLFSWPRRATCGILIPQPGIEPPPLGRQCLDYWTTRENLSTRSFLHLLQSVWSETKGVELVSNKRHKRSNQDLVPKIQAKGYKPSNKSGAWGVGHGADYPDQGRGCIYNSEMRAESSMRAPSSIFRMQ